VKVVDFRAQVRFSPEKMQKNEVFATPLLQCDVYCFEAGQAQKVHKHTTSDKVYLVLEGAGRFTIGRTTRELKSGQSVLVNAGEDHGVVNMTEEKLVCIVMTAPPAALK